MESVKLAELAADPAFAGEEKWKQIAAHMCGRTPADCRERQSHLARWDCEWTAEEDVRLAELAPLRSRPKSLQPSFEEVAAHLRFFFGKRCSGASCFRRWKLLKARRGRDEQLAIAINRELKSRAFRWRLRFVSVGSAFELYVPLRSGVSCVVAHGPRHELLHV